MLGVIYYMIRSVADLVYFWSKVITQKMEKKLSQRTIIPPYVLWMPALH